MFEKTCSKCGFEVKASKKKHFETCDGQGPRRKRPHPFAGKRDWAKGLTKETSPVIAKISTALKGRTIKPAGWKHTDATRQKMSESALRKYARGYEGKCGRAPKLAYESPIAGHIKVDGSWELKVAKHLDALGVTWKRNKVRFDYIKPDGKRGTYCPDFYVEEWKTFIEVKGYKTQLDECKWSQFQHPLEVWDKQKIKSLESNPERVSGAVC